MRPCQICLENNWSFKNEDDKSTTATCKNCGHEVNFNGKKKEKFYEGALCRKCGNKIRIKESKFKPSKLKKPYYYTAYYYCDKCRTGYYSDKFKVINKSLF